MELAAFNRTLGHPAAAAARAEASTLAGKRDQTISAAPRTPKPGKPMREHAAANESLKLALHEQGGASLFVMSIELPEEGLEVLADDAVEDPVLRSATHVRSRNRLARSRGVKLHDHRTPSRLVPRSAPAFSACLRSMALKRGGGRRRKAGGRHPWHMRGLALPEATAANKPKALSAASGD